MRIWEICLIGLGLSMDAFAVALSNGLVYTNLNGKRALLPPLVFGFFQGLMPLLGYFLMSFFTAFVSAFANVLAFIILTVIGAGMIRSGIKGEGNAGECGRKLSTGGLVLQAVSTSIDAFAVGVGFGAMEADIFFSASVIAITTFLSCVIAVGVGRKFGTILGKRSEMIGGLILVGIGIHMFF